MNIAWTYDTLFAALQAWPTDDSDQYVTEIPNIIGLGELRLVRDLNLDLFDISDDSQSTVAGTRTITKPSETIVIREIGIEVDGAYVPLEKRSLTYCKMYAPDSSVQDQPEFWCEESPTEILLVPTPDAAYPVHQYANARPQDSLSLSNQGPSWLSRCVPDALFASCLMEAEHFLKADDRYADYRAKYQEIIQIARLELRSAIRNGDYSPLKAGAVTQ